MSTIARLAGAILVEGDGQYFLVGNPKEPCDFAKAGFEPPGAIDAVARPFVRLSPLASGPVLTGTRLRVAGAGEALARVCAARFVIERNGSISERLWRLVVDDADGALDGRWLVEMPDAIWQIVRDTVLKCS